MRNSRPYKNEREVYKLSKRENDFSITWSSTSKMNINGRKKRFITYTTSKKKEEHLKNA